MIVFKLAKVILKNFEMIAIEKKKSKIFFITMALVTALIIMIPAAIMMGIISYGMTEVLLEYKGSNQGVNLMLYGISIFSFVFCINVVLNVFYFSGDITYLLPMPLKPEEIVGAKFISSLISESAMQFILVFSCLTGFIIAGGYPIYTYLVAILAIITVPIIPLVYCGIICILLMRFVRIIRNKDLVNKIMGALMILIVIGVVALLGVISSFDIDNFTISLINDNQFLRVMNIIFPQINFLTRSIANQNFLDVLIYIGINVVALVVFLLIAKLFYFKGVINLNESGGLKRQKKLTIRFQSPFASCFWKEVKVLFKTPAYFMNCVIVNYIWPIFVYILVVLYQKSGQLSEIMIKYHNGDGKTHMLFIIAIIGSSILITAINSIASSSISREGSQFYVMKEIPVNYKVQLHAKALSSIFISALGMLIYLIGVGIYLEINFGIWLLYCLLCILSIGFISYLGLFLDTINPKLIWDEEINALRGNHTVFINMAISILVTGLLIISIYGLFQLSLPLFVLFILAFVILIGFSLGAFFICLKKGPSNLKELSC